MISFTRLQVVFALAFLHNANGSLGSLNPLVPSDHEGVGRKSQEHGLVEIGQRVPLFSKDAGLERHRVVGTLAVLHRVACERPDERGAVFYLAPGQAPTTAAHGVDAKLHD